MVHLSPQRRAVGGDLADGYDLLAVQRHEGVEFLHCLHSKHTVTTDCESLQYYIFLFLRKVLLHLCKI